VHIGQNWYERSGFFLKFLTWLSVVQELALNLQRYGGVELPALLLTLFTDHGPGGGFYVAMQMGSRTSESSRKLPQIAFVFIEVE
jgi:hypothetical protein